MHERIGVLYGGKSHERPGSLISGAAVMEALRRRHYDVLPIDPAVDDVSSALRSVSRAFIALHG
jgi:D-alanine-D-alanine ligase